MLRVLLLSLLGLGSLLSLAGCQTAASRDFTRLKPGMEKVDVVDIMGDPQRKIRRNGVDKWTYIYYDNKVRTENEVHFSQGVATYVGPNVPPAISAEQQDAMNAAENAALEKQIAQRRQENNGNLERYEREMRGQDDEVHQPTINWEPIQ